MVPYRSEGIAVKTSETRVRQTLGQAMPAVLSTAIVSMAVCGEANAAAPSFDSGSTGHALLLFAIAWFIASLRLRKTDGRWRAGFELSPVKGLDELAATKGSVQEGRKS